MAKLTDLYVNIGAKIDPLKRGLKDAEGELKGFGTSVSKIGTLIAGAFAVSTIAAFTREASRLALGVDEIESAFKRINDPGLLVRLREAVSNTVSDVNLMKSAIRAESLGVPLRQLGTYFEFAERQAGALGISTEQVIDQIMNGIGNKATRSFRQLGISAIELNKAFAGIEPEMLSVESVSDRVFLVISDKLREMGVNIDSATDKIDRQAAAWENTMVSVGKLVNEIKAVFAPAITWAANKLTLFFESGGNIPLMMAKNKLMNDTADAVKKRMKYEEDLNKVIEEGDIRKRVAAENARIAAEKEKKAQDELNKLAERAGNIIEKRGPNAFIAPGVPNETMPETNTSPAIWKDAQNNLSNLDSAVNKVTESYNGAEKAAALFAESVAMSAGGVESFQDAANVIRHAAKQAIAAFVAETVALQVAKAAKQSKTWWGAILAGGVAAAGTAALFEQVVPSFAEGGVVRGKQLAMIGDNPSGVEAVIPKEMWGKIGGQQRLPALAAYGKDLYWVNKNYTDYLNKTT